MGLAGGEMPVEEAPRASTLSCSAHFSCLHRPPLAFPVVPVGGADQTLPPSVTKWHRCPQEAHAGEMAPHLSK